MVDGLAESRSSAGTYRDADECIDAHVLRTAALRSLGRPSSCQRADDLRQVEAAQVTHGVRIGPSCRPRQLSRDTQPAALCGLCEAQPMRSASETMIPSGPRT